MENEKVIAILKQKYTAFTNLQRQAEIIMSQIQAIAEAVDLTAEQVNMIIGVNLFSDSKPEEPQEQNRQPMPCTG